MKKTKLLSLLFIGTILTPFVTSVYAGIRDDNQACYYASGGGGHYYFCGEFHKGDTCDGHTYRPAYDKEYGYGHGDKKTMDDGGTYFCCNKNGKKYWKYDKDIDWITNTKTSTKLKTNSDGTTSLCTTTTKYTVCSEPDPDSVVTECHNCTETAPYYRNGECTTFCGQTDYTMAFEGVNSNNCIECKTTKTQGIAEIDMYGCNWSAGEKWDTENNKCTDKGDSETPAVTLFNVCMKCNPETQFFDTKTKRCVTKSELPQKNKTELRQCWTAFSTAAYRCCIENGADKLEEYNDKKKPDDISTKVGCCVNGGIWNGNSCQIGTSELPL